MMKKKMIGQLVLTVCLLGGGLGMAGEPAATSSTTPIPTIAVLPFESKVAKEGVGSAIADLLTVKLGESGDMELADRVSIDKTMAELNLSASGLVGKDSQVKIGQLVGARIIITGSVFKSGDNKSYIVAKVIGVETSLVKGCSVSGIGDPLEMVPDLSNRIQATIRKNVAALLPPVLTRPTILEELKKSYGSGSGKKVYVKVSEQTAQNIDPAAETELQKLLQSLEFTVVESPDQADFRITGDGIAEQSGHFKGFFSATARLELRLYAKDGTLIASDRQVETVAGPAANVAAKEALAQAALALSKRLVPQIK